MAATADMQFLIDRLDGMLQQSRRAFFGGRIQVDEAEFAQIIDQMRAAFPQEVKQARRVLQERENIIKSAQDDAEGIVVLARKSAEHMVSEHGVVQEAKHRSEQLLRDAEEERESVVDGARRFALDAITEVQGALDSLDTAVSSNRTRVRRVMDRLQDGQ